MFLVKDKVAERKKRICQFLDTEPPIAVILSAVHFEWTVRRAIIALGNSTNKEIRKQLERCHGLPMYKAMWCEEAYCTSKNIPKLTEVVNNWEQFKRDFDLRHKLVHGIESCSKKFASPKVESILTAADDILNFCKGKGISLEKRLPVKRKRKS